MRWLALVVAFGACHAARTEQQPAMTTLDRIAPLAVPLPQGARRDCRPSPLVRTWFAHAARSGVRPCGSLGLGATAHERSLAHRCLVESMKNREAFLVEQQVPESDGVVAHVLLGVDEDDRGALVVYRADYDAPSCIGACSIIRNLRLSSCQGAALQPCSDDLSSCIRCETEREFASCSLFDDRPQPL